MRPRPPRESRRWRAFGGPRTGVACYQLNLVWAVDSENEVEILGKRLYLGNLACSVWPYHGRHLGHKNATYAECGLQTSYHGRCNSIPIVLDSNFGQSKVFKTDLKINGRMTHSFVSYEEQPCRNSPLPILQPGGRDIDPLPPGRHF